MTETLRNDRDDDNIQHGIDDDSHNDAEKGAVLGGVGGAIVGGAAGAMTGPAGAVVGAAVGAAGGAIGSGLAVGAVDSIDNDDNITGVGDDVTPDLDNDVDDTALNDNVVIVDDNLDNLPSTSVDTTTHQTDTRGVVEKSADAVTGDEIDDKTGRRV